jgi:hypothetical protein
MVDIGNHSSIYHLHIPRTGGVFIRNQLLEKYKELECFATHYEKLEQSNINKYFYVAGHFGTYPIQYMNNPVVFTVLRNPVDRFLSYYKYTKPFFKTNMLNEWLYNEDLSAIHSNTQIKFLTNKIDIDKYNNNLVNDITINNNWFIGQDLDLQKAKSFVDNNIVFVMEEIDDVFGISNGVRVNKSGKQPIITPEQYDRIVELNSLDIELYDYAIRAKNY